MFHFIVAGYWLKFSTSNNHTSGDPHWLWYCHCAKLNFTWESPTTWTFFLSIPHGRWHQQHQARYCFSIKLIILLLSVLHSHTYKEYSSFYEYFTCCHTTPLSSKIHANYNAFRQLKWTHRNCFSLQVKFAEPIPVYLTIKSVKTYNNWTKITQLLSHCAFPLALKCRDQDSNLGYYGFTLSDPTT